MSKFREEWLSDNIRLICGDCLEVMPTLGKVDAVVTDPPYEELMQSLHSSVKLRRLDGGNARRELNFQSIAKIREPFLDWCSGNVNGWLLAFCNIEGVWHWREAITKRGIKFKTTCIWHKPDSTPKLNGQGPAICYECITTSWCGAGHSKWNGGGSRGLWAHNTNNRDRHGVHPTEKPVSLMKEIVALFSNYGELVMDPFMGSGTTGVACVKLGRKFIGIELDSNYFDIACKRIADAMKQPDMFIESAPPLLKPKQEALDV